MSTNPLDDAIKQMGATLGKSLARGALIMQAQFAIAAGVEGDDQALRDQLGRLTPQQRAEIRQAAKLVAKTVKAMAEATDTPKATA
jgi:hypothetical protein